MVISLARWGGALLGAPDPALEWRADWTVVALRGRFDAAAAAGLDEAYQFVVDGQPFWAAIHAGELETGLGETESPAVTVIADRASFTGVAAGELSLADAIAGGTYSISGDPAALERAARISPPPA